MANRTIKQYKLDLYSADNAAGKYDMPCVRGEDYIPESLMPFNYVLSKRAKSESGIHFFIDDYQFERVWRNLTRYIEVLKKHDCVLTPDFSLYVDMPKAMMIWNTYRSRLIGQMMQDNGLMVIPTVSWGDTDSYEFCFDGLPTEATLAISTIGTNISEESKLLFRLGMAEMIDRLQPKNLLIYGRCTYPVPDTINVKRYDNERIEFFRSLKGVTK